MAEPYSTPSLTIRTNSPDGYEFVDQIVEMSANVADHVNVGRHIDERLLLHQQLARVVEQREENVQRVRRHVHAYSNPRQCYSTP